MRLCKGCEKPYPEGDEYTRPSPRRYRCKPCYNDYQRGYNATYRETHREEARVASQAWRDADPERSRASTKAWRRRQREAK